METELKTIYNKIPSADRFLFLFTFLANIFVHAYTYMNQLFFYDGCHVYDDSNGLNNGRFLVGPIMTIFSNFQIPWVSGIIFSICMALSVVLVSKILEIQDKVFQVLLSLLMISFPVIFFTHTCIGTLIIYGMAILFATLTVYYLTIDKLSYAIMAMISMIISLACYQAYISYAVSLFLIYIIKLFSENYANKEVIKKFLKGALVFIVSIGIYFVIWKTLLYFIPTDVPDYRGENLAAATIFSNSFKNIFVAYSLGIKSLFGNISFHSKTYAIQYGVQFFVISCDIFFICKTKKPTVLLTFLMLPLGVYLLYVFSPYAFHEMMRYSLIIPYILFIYFASKAKIKKGLFEKANIKKIACIVLSVFIFNNIVTGNMAYVKNYTETQKSLSMATRLVDRIECFGANPGDKIIFVEKNNQNWFCIDSNTAKHDIKYKDSREWEKYTNGYTTDLGSIGAPYINALIWYIEDNCDYIGLSYQSLEQNSSDAQKIKTIVSELDSFPYQNCMYKLSNDTIVVCL